MTNLQPHEQPKLFGLDTYFMELVNLYKKNNLPKQIILNGQKGLGKATLAFHLINFILSSDEENKYDLKNFQINQNSHTFKTILNKSNPNLILIDISQEKNVIEINQIRELISNLNKSSFNQKPKFVLIDNIEFLNVYSINALLKILEEPAMNVHFILIKNNKKILSTLLSRCINFKISLTNKECLEIAEKLINENIHKIINTDLINYYFTHGNIYRLINFGKEKKIDLLNLDLKNFLKTIIDEKFYKKEISINYLIFDFIEFYFTKQNFLNIKDNYNHFLKRISDTKKYNLDLESLFIEFEQNILNG